MTRLWNGGWKQETTAVELKRETLQVTVFHAEWIVVDVEFAADGVNCQ